MNDKVKKPEVFVFTDSEKMKTLETELNNKVNTPENGVKVYDQLLQDEVQKIETWAIEVARKASTKYFSLKEECKKAKDIKPDMSQYREDGLKVERYSEKTWKTKIEPFNKIKVLSKQLDDAITKGTVEEFKKLEKLIK
ncbi:MAG TPA: hypothetical protein VK982_11125 [Bacteroidales bacterium]|nr:hypothetical protein [Bacteroidales bacterium]